MAAGYVRAFQEGDCEALAPILRIEDQREVQANSGLTALQALQRGAGNSEILCTVIGPHGIPAALYGVSTGGRIWLLGSDALTKAPLKWRFLKECRRHVALLQQRYPILHNVIDERNTVHVEWLKWMGFTFIKRHPFFGYEQRPFLEFLRIQTDV